MAISIDPKRPKADSEKPVTLDISPGDIIEYGGKREGFLFPVVALDLKQPEFTVGEVSVAKGSPDITTTGNSFQDVKVGDLISGEGIPNDTIVIAKENDNHLTLNNDATSEGTEILTFTPSGSGKISPTLFGVGVDLVRQGGNIVAKLTYYSYSGELGAEAGDETNADLAIPLGDYKVDVDKFLTAARIPREN